MSSLGLETGNVQRLGFRSLSIETSPEKMANAYEWHRRLGFRETTVLDLAAMDGVVALELPLTGPA
jgi:hypothetical protein